MGEVYRARRLAAWPPRRHQGPAGGVRGRSGAARRASNRRRGRPRPRSITRTSPSVYRRRHRGRHATTSSRSCLERRDRSATADRHAAVRAARASGLRIAAGDRRARSRPRIARASSIATSSPRTSWCRTDGRAKVLDFGLAKLAEPGAAAASAAHSPTMLGTMAGVVHGHGRLSWRPSRRRVSRRTGAPTSSRWAASCTKWSAGERPFDRAQCRGSHRARPARRAAAGRPTSGPAYRREFQRIVRRSASRRTRRDGTSTRTISRWTSAICVARPACRRQSATSAAARHPAGAVTDGSGRPRAVALSRRLARGAGFDRTPAAVTAQPPTRLALVVPNFGGSATAIQRQIAITPDGGTLLFPAIVDGRRNPHDAHARFDDIVAIPGAARYRSVPRRLRDFA